MEKQAKENLVKSLTDAQRQQLENDLTIEQGQTLLRATDISIEIENQALINELHKCIKATRTLNDLRNGDI